MNIDSFGVNLSETLLSQSFQHKSKDLEFFDFAEDLSAFHSCEQIPKSNVFKSFSEESKHAINSEISVRSSKNRSDFSNRQTLNDKKKKAVYPFKSILDGEGNSKNSKCVSINVLTKTIKGKYENNFEDPNMKINQKGSNVFEDINLNLVWLEAPRLDLTNRFINLITQSIFFQKFYMLLTFFNISLRIYLMYYFYKTYMEGFEMGSFYLCFFYIPRICYMLSMVKLLFHVNDEEIFIERISVGFNSFDKAPIKSWNDQLNYDYEINMNDFFGRKKNLVKKWKKKPLIIEYKSTLKAFFKRALIILIPVETTIVFFKLFYNETQKNKGCFLKLFLIANWIYQCYECLLIIPCIFCLYFLEYKFNDFSVIGDNSNYMSFIIQLWEVSQFFVMNFILMVSNCQSVKFGPFEFHNYSL